ncbi:MAG: amidohydrolase [Burkholderiaceae bacterium]|nr:amidohydrolase [Burkholderiaceae bacterium]
MRRRDLLRALTVGALAPAVVRAQPCALPLPPALARHELVQAAWEGLEPARVWDAHAHLIGTGDSGSGAYVDPRTETWRHPVERIRRKLVLAAACLREGEPIDRGYVERLLAQAQAMPEGFRLLLFAFDYAVDEEGREQPALSTFHTPNDYAAAVARTQAGRLGWVASVHPYRQDALPRLAQAIAAGACAVKWLPSAMNIDPASPRCDPFYAELARRRLPLIVHCGEEVAAPGARQEAFNNPLRLRRALDAGVRIVVAHAATLGEARDLDTGGEYGPWVPSFALFRRLFDDRRYEKLLFADLAAVFQRNRALAVQREILRRTDWHARLLHGSDYPLPGMPFIYALDRFVDAGWLSAAEAEVLRAIRAHNPLLFEFVLKRTLRDGPHRLSEAVFHTRDFFAAV